MGRNHNSLYSEEYATFEEDTVYNQRTEGFIKINALRLKLHHYRKNRSLESGDTSVDIGALRRTTSNKVSQIDRALLHTSTFTSSPPRCVFVCQRRYAAAISDSRLLHTLGSHRGARIVVKNHG